MRTPSAFRIACLGLVVAAVLHAQIPSDAPDLTMYGRIRDEGINRWLVRYYATELMDGIGPRLTGSCALDVRATAARSQTPAFPLRASFKIHSSTTLGRTTRTATPTNG